MYEELFVKIVCAVITIVASIITYVLVPYIKKKIDSDSLEKLENYVEWAVRCAEQMYTTEQWELKKLYVVQYITGLAESQFNLHLTEEDINVMIEATVNAVKRG